MNHFSPKETHSPGALSILTDDTEVDDVIDLEHCSSLSNETMTGNIHHILEKKRGKKTTLLSNLQAK